MPWDSPWTLEFRPVLLHGVPVDRDPQTGLVGHPYVAVGIDGERLLNEVSPEGRVFDTVLKQRRVLVRGTKVEVGSDDDVRRISVG